MRRGALAERHSQHPARSVKVQGEMGRASGAEPKMFALADLAPAAVEAGVVVVRQSFRQEQLAFVEGSKGDSTPWVRAFVEHGWVQSSSAESSAREVLLALHVACRTLRGKLGSFHYADTAS